MRHHTLPLALAGFALALTGCAGAPSPALAQASGPTAEA